MWGRSNRLIAITIFICLIGSSLSINNASSGSFEASINYADRGSYSYHNYTTLVEDMEALNDTYSNIFELTTAQSEFGLPDCVDGYKVWLIRITNEALGFNKPEVLFIGGHHGNEKISVEVAYYFAEWLVSNYENDDHVKYLIDHREIYIIPVINSWGWANNIREDGNGEDVNRDYPYANASFNPALTTIGARAVHEIMARHLFISAISWHSGVEGIYYAWGTPVHDTPTDESPDTVAFYGQARLMSAQGGNYGGKYQFGPANEVVYGARGAWSDYAYAATWDTQYTAPVYPTNGSRALAIGVEISNDYTPPAASLGNSKGVYEPDGPNDGYIPKNIRMALVLTDTAQPYINWNNRNSIPTMAYPGQNISFEWEVKGAVSVDETRIHYDDSYVESSVSTIDKYQTPDQSGWSGWFDNTFTEHIIMPKEPGDYYFVVSAVVDQNTLDQTIPEPDIEPQSLYVNQRTNANWKVSNNGNSLEGQKVWYSEVIKITVQEQGFVYITNHPDLAVTRTTINLNWTVGVSTDFALNYTAIHWGNRSDPMNDSDFITEGFVVNEEVINSYRIFNYSTNITMPIHPDIYYFSAYALLDYQLNQTAQHNLWSVVITVEVRLPPEGYGLIVTTPKVGYSGNMTQQIDITGVGVTCPDLGDDDFNVNMLKIHQFNIYTYEDEYVKTGDLNWNGFEWQALGVNISELPEGEYYVACLFEFEYGYGSSVQNQSGHNVFENDHILKASLPALEYTGGNLQILNITNITVRCSCSDQKVFNVSNLDSYRYIIREDDNPWERELEGNLSWNGEHWEALNINVTSLFSMRYEVRILFYHEYGFAGSTAEFNVSAIEYDDNITDDDDIWDDEVSVESIQICIICTIIIAVIVIILLAIVILLRKNRKK